MKKRQKSKALIENSLNCVCVLRMRTIGGRDRTMTLTSSSFSFLPFFHRNYHENAERESLSLLSKRKQTRCQSMQKKQNESKIAKNNCVQLATLHYCHGCLSLSRCVNYVWP